MGQTHRETGAQRWEGNRAEHQRGLQGGGGHRQEAMGRHGEGEGQVVSEDRPPPFAQGCCLPQAPSPELWVSTGSSP